MIRKDSTTPTGGRRRGGICTYIKNNIPFRNINVNTNFDIQAIEIKTNQALLTIINFYAPPDVSFPDFLHDLEIISNSVSASYILCGDINAHHPLWETRRTYPDQKGELFSKFLDDQNLIILNTGCPTFPAVNLRNNSTTPDITATSPPLTPRATWHTSPDPLCSDHLPIHITLGHNTTPITTIPRFNIKKAHWHEYTEQIEHTNIQHPTVHKITDTITQAAKDHIPLTKRIQKPLKSAPWWNEECKRAITFRNTARQRFERNKNQDNLLNYRKAKARCRRIIREAKQKSFEEMANTFNRFTPLTKIWNTIKSFTGHKTPINKATIITHNNNTYTTPEDIAQQFAEHYNTIASSCPPPTPLIIPNPQTSDQPYNLPLTLTELEDAINRTGNSAPGPDQIHYHCFKHLGKKGKVNLLKALNHAFSTNSYPDSWFHAHAIPILKPNKPSTNPSSYRPISLTNTIHKIFERIIKNRLLYITQKQNLISPNQCGFLPGRSTTDNLVKITSDIRNSLSSKNTTAALFLDLKNAYDTLNITPLLHLLQQNISGHLLHYLNSYLTKRSFQVKFLDKISDPKKPTSGLMQGSVLSPILFIIALNSTLKSVPHPNKIALYADDIAIWTSHSNQNTALKNLEFALKHVQNALTPLNLHISPDKSQCVLFQLRKPPDNPTPLFLNNIPIPFTQEAKFLGITLDRSLTFNSHINNIKTRASKRINILKVLSGTDFGGDSKTLLLLYKSIIRPILEYASLIFENAAQTHLQKLDTVQNTALRIVTSALRTTPTDSLHTYTNTQTLTQRRTIALFKYFYKIQKIKNHPCIPIIKFQANPRFLLRKKHEKQKAYGTRITHHSRNLNLPLPIINPSPPTAAWWTWRKPKLILLLNEKKSNYNPPEILQLFFETIHEFARYTQYYTDGSKTGERTAAAAVRRDRDGTLNTILNDRLPNNTNIFSAELKAILAAYQNIKINNLSKSIIISDSLSALQSIDPKQSQSHPLLTQIFEIQNDLPTLPVLMWIPSHTGIPLNEKVDQIAKDATKLPDITELPPMPDEFLLKIIKQVHNEAQLQWNTSLAPLRIIHPTLGKWETNNQNSKLKETALARLRLGHTRPTHSYIILKSPQPSCPTCNHTRLTVRHLLLDCPKFNSERQYLITTCNRHNIPLNLQNLLGDDYPSITKALFKYLSDTGLISKL